MKTLGLRLLVIACVLGSLGFSHSCSTGYYGHQITGHLSLMSNTHEIPSVLNRQNLDGNVRRQLITALEIRTFASEEMALPENASYTSYVDLEREYVSWVVTAAPEFSLDKRDWCFPVAGCVSYRGYYDEARAHRYADRLARQGYDVDVSGITAYSTLGWFDDPIFSPMLRGGEPRLAEEMFHELAHQELYVPGAPSFNEAYASFVGEQGTKRWLSDRGDEEALRTWLSTLRRRAGFDALLARTREELRAIYDREVSEAVKQDQKQAAFNRLKERFRELRRHHPEFRVYSTWFEGSLNNASIGHNATYRKWVPAFRVLFEEQNRNFRRFHQEVARLADLPGEARENILQDLLSRSDNTGRWALMKEFVEEQFDLQTL